MKSTRSSEEIRIEKIKILFQFSIMLIASIVLGVCLSRLFSAELKAVALSSILRHFSPQTVSGGALTSFFEYLRFSLFDIIAVVVLLVFSFSFINYVVSDIVIVIYGAKLGIGASLMLTLQGIRAFDKVIFFTFRPLILLLIILFCYKMALYSLDIRSFSTNGRFVADKKKTLSMLIGALAFIGLMLIVNGLYCLCLYI